MTQDRVCRKTVTFQTGVEIQNPPGRYEISRRGGGWTKAKGPCTREGKLEMRGK